MICSTNDFFICRILAVWFFAQASFYTISKSAYKVLQYESSICKKNDSSFFEDSEAVSYRLGCFYTISQKLVGKNPEGWLHKKNSTTCGWTSLSKCQWQTRWQFKQ